MRKGSITVVARPSDSSLVLGATSPGDGHSEIRRYARGRHGVRDADGAYWMQDFNWKHNVPA
jgi:hypothetical protein